MGLSRSVRNRLATGEPSIEVVGDALHSEPPNDLGDCDAFGQPNFSRSQFANDFFRRITLPRIPNLLLHTELFDSPFGAVMWTPVTRKKYSRNASCYQSDVTDKEWRVIEPLLPGPRTSSPSG